MMSDLSDRLTERLVHAAMRGDGEAVRRCLEQGADVNGTAFDGWSPLYAAARCGGRAVADQLREAGARDDLLTAAMLADAPRVRRLLEAGADPNATDTDGTSPLMWAAYRGEVEILRALLGGGARVDYVTPHRTSAVDWICRRNGQAVIEVFESAGVQVGLFERIRIDDGAYLTAELRRGVDPNLRGPFERTLLHQAVQSGAKECVRLLLEAGADPYAWDTEGDAPITDALESQVIHLLVTAGMDPNEADRAGWSPLHHAAHAGCVEAARTLVELGADVNAQDSMGRTPLATALLSMAARRREVAGVLREAGGVVRFDRFSLRLHLVELLHRGDAAFLQALLEAGMPPDARDPNGETALMMVAQQGDLPLVEVLVEAGADVNAESDRGFTPLVYAAEAGDPEVVRLLLSQGARVRDTAGWLALRKAESRGHTQVAALLREAGARDR